MRCAPFRLRLRQSSHLSVPKRSCLCASASSFHFGEMPPMSASPPRGIAELTAVIEELPEEYGLNLIRQLTPAELPVLKAKLERITEREATSPSERATRTRLTTFLAEVRQRMPSVVSQPSNTRATAVKPQ